MTLDELRTIYEEAQTIINRERKMRLWVFRDRPEELKRKLAEMDRLRKIVADMKDALKELLPPEYEQPQLLDVPPKRAEYN